VGSWRIPDWRPAFLLLLRRASGHGSWHMYCNTRYMLTSQARMGSSGAPQTSRSPSSSRTHEDEQRGWSGGRHLGTCANGAELMEVHGPIVVCICKGHTVSYTSDKRTHKPAHVPLKPTLVEGVDVDVVNGIATDARTVTAGRCLCHKHNDSASCLGVTMHATDCMQAWATRSDRSSTQARGSSSCAHAHATYGEQHATRHASQGDTSPILCWPTCPRYVYLVSEPGSERPFGRSAQANGRQ